MKTDNQKNLLFRLHNLGRYDFCKKIVRALGPPPKFEHRSTKRLYGATNFCLKLFFIRRIEHGGTRFGRASGRLSRVSKRRDFVTAV